METPINPYKKLIGSLDAVSKLSILGGHAVQIFRDHMVCDPSHDERHIVRVVKNAMWFAEGSDLDVLIPACVLHDLVNVPKNSELRPMASRLSADKAIEELRASGWLTDDEQAAGIHHAIIAHSWSANVNPVSFEAKALQDADRIESLGHVGIARLFAVGGSMGRALFHPSDPLAEYRTPDELTYTLDHYFVKLQRLSNTMKTERGWDEAKRLTEKMQNFVAGLVEELY